MAVDRGVSRRLLAAVTDLRLRGVKNVEIARQLGISTRTVLRYLGDARREVSISDSMRRMKAVAVPLAVDNLIEGLADGDKDYTLETLKGTLWAKQGDGAGQAAPMNFALQVIVEQPPADRLVSPDVVIGNVVGIARQLTGALDAEHEPETA